MKKVNDVRITVTFVYDYTDTVNQMIDDKECSTMDELKDILRDFIREDIETHVFEEGLDDDDIKIEIT